MFCFKYRRKLMRYVEGELHGKVRLAVGEHIARCGKCMAEVERLRAVSSTLHKVDFPAVDPAPDTRERVLARIAQAERPPRRGFALGMASATALASLIVAAILVIHSSNIPVPRPVDENSFVERPTRDAYPDPPTTKSSVEVVEAPGESVDNAAARDLGKTGPSIMSGVSSSTPAPAAAPREEDKISRKDSADSELVGNKEMPGPAGPVTRSAAPAPLASPPCLEEAKVPKTQEAGDLTASSGASVAAFSAAPSEKAQETATREVGLDKSDPLRAVVESEDRAGRLDRAVATQKQVLVDNPEDEQALRFLLAAHQYQNQHKQAIEVLDRLIAKRPNNPRLYKDLGSAQLALGQKSEAVSAWKKGLEVDPTSDKSGIIPAAKSAGVLPEIKSAYHNQLEKKPSDTKAQKILEMIEAAK